MITDERKRGEILGGLRHEMSAQGSLIHAFAAEELERLWKTLAKLPVTEDGVIVIPSMDKVYFTVGRGHVRTEEIAWNSEDNKWVVAQTSAAISDGCFSTPEAALKAAKAGKEE